MSGHTPWITGGDSDPTAILCSENYNQIAAVNDALDGWNGHARLIAAAPDLLAALQSAREWHRGDKWRGTDKNDAWQAQADLLDDVIAKATGAQA